jgi:Fe-S-cluster containining protein
MLVRSLSVHAEYRCRRSGACCTSNWPIPIEADRLSRLRIAIADGHLTPRPGAPPFARDRDAPALLGVSAGACVFFDASTRLCRVHDALGHDALPLACRQFPRVVLRDPRGVSVVLSHYCPTAAALLDDAVGFESGETVTIVASPAGFPSSAEYEGLDARESLPPLLRLGVLMDWESWWDLEQRTVDLLANSADSPARALARLHGIVEHTRTWQPGSGALRDHIRDAFDASTAALHRGAHIDVNLLCGEVRQAVPAEFDAPPPRGRSTDQRVLKRFLAAHAFASWTPFIGGSLRAWRRSIDTAYALIVSGHDVRTADLLLRHLAEPHVLARIWIRAEQDVEARATVARSRRAGRSNRS